MYALILSEDGKVDRPGLTFSLGRSGLTVSLGQSGLTVSLGWVDRKPGTVRFERQPGMGWPMLHCMFAKCWVAKRHTIRVDPPAGTAGPWAEVCGQALQKPGVHPQGLQWRRTVCCGVLEGPRFWKARASTVALVFPAPSSVAVTVCLCPSGCALPSCHMPRVAAAYSSNAIQPCPILQHTPVAALLCCSARQPRFILAHF